jgi:cephalosporin-C deacetylase-like acetyl esterase
MVIFCSVSSHRMSRQGILQLLVVMALAGGLGACGSASTPKPGGAAVRAQEYFAYDRSAPLRAVVHDAAQTAGVRVKRITYATTDGASVPALLALPRTKATKGCLIYQSGAGSTKEQAASLWPAATALGLGVFTIDTRYTGARATDPKQLLRVLRSTERTLGMIRGDVLDLRRAVDYLEQRPECRRNIGFLGTSQGALLGALLAGADTRIHAAVLTSIGATWRSALLYDTDVLVPGVTENPRAMERAVRTLTPIDAARWVGKIAPRPLMLIDGLRDPRVPVVQALDLAAAAREPKTLVLHRGGHDPFAAPDGAKVNDRVGVFLLNELVEYGAP